MQRRFQPLTSPGGPAVVGIASGLLLAVAVFLPWYSTNLGAPASPGSASGWAWTAVAKGVLILGVVWALASALLLADHLDRYRIDSRTAEALGWLVTGAALLAAGLVAFRLFTAAGARGLPDPRFRPVPQPRRGRARRGRRVRTSRATMTRWRLRGAPRNEDVSSGGHRALREWQNFDPRGRSA